MRTALVIRAYALSWALAAMTGTAVAAKYSAPRMEVVQLPQFCWAQYMDGVEGPQYSISRPLCGVGMNHYCPALLALMRAKKTFGGRAEMKQRRHHLAVARKEILYTLRNMQPYPNCDIRGHVERSRSEVETMLKATERLLGDVPAR